MKNAIFGGGEVACFLFSLFSVSFFFFFLRFLCNRNSKGLLDLLKKLFEYNSV